MVPARAELKREVNLSSRLPVRHEHWVGHAPGGCATAGECEQVLDGDLCLANILVPSDGPGAPELEEEDGAAPPEDIGCGVDGEMHGEVPCRLCAAIPGHRSGLLRVRVAGDGGLDVDVHRGDVPDILQVLRGHDNYLQEPAIHLLSRQAKSWLISIY